MENAVELPNMNNTDLWLAAIVGEVEEGVLIAKVLRPSAPVPVEEGDVVRSMNDEAVSGVASLKKRFALLEEGERVTFVVLREGEETTLSYTHPDPSTLPRLEFRVVE
jgi:S1-C subfamily serine protease